MRNRTLSYFAAGLGAVCLFAVSATAEITTTPKEPTSQRVINGEIHTEDGGIAYTKVAAPGDTAWIRVWDGTECDATGIIADGGQGILAPGYGTWCWEGGALGGGLFDTCATTAVYGGGLPGCFDHYDVFSALTNKWHLDTFDDYLNGGVSPWCGEFGDPLIWQNAYGYGPAYNFSLILNLGSRDSGPNTTGFDATTGFTIAGVHMYDVEINYDYCYLEYAVSNDSINATWLELARFNGTSNVDGGCTGTGGPDPTYGCAQFEAFSKTGPAVANGATSLYVRWRFAADNAWDDEDASGGVHTDGAWRVDDVYADGLNGGTDYFSVGTPQTFGATHNGAMPSQWSTPNFPGAQLGGFWSGGFWVNGTPVSVDWWHLELDPSYSNKGNTCTYSNNWIWTADDVAFGQNQEDAYHYRLTSPVFDTSVNNVYWDPNNDGPGADNKWTGIVLEFDSYLCIKDVVGDVTDQQVRVYDGTANVWGQWGGDNYVNVGGCQFWNVDARTDWSSQLTATSDSIQFSWEFLDRCDYNSAGELPCMGQHRKATFLVDNVSFGVFQSRATQWSLGGANQFMDTFARDTDMHSAGKENWELFAADVWEDEDSLQIEVRDFDGLKGGEVKVHWRISTDCGQNFDLDNGRPAGGTAEPVGAYNSKALNFSLADDPIGCPGTPCEFNGSYRSRIRISENTGYLGGGATEWPEGTLIEYFFVAEDSAGNVDTFPNRLSIARTSADLINTTIGHDRRLEWPFQARVLPCPTAKVALGAGQNQRVLLVSRPQGRTYDVETDPTQAQAGTVAFPQFRQIWRESLDRLGVVYDEYRIYSSGVSRGGGTPIYSEPFDHDGYGGAIARSAGAITGRRYESVVWFTGRFNDNLVMADSTQLEVATFLDKNATNFSGGANLFLAGNDVCEANELSDPAWVDANTVQTTNSAEFWTNLAGLNAEVGGCADDGGLSSAPGGNVIGLVGQAGTIMSDLTALVGYWDCPLLDNPDEITANGATEIMDFASTGGPTMFRNVIPHAGPGADSKVIVSSTPIDLYTSAQMRDCVLQAVLTDFGVGIPTPNTNCVIDVGVDTGVPQRVTLHQNTPNPFNPTTKIRFSIPSQQKVDLKIFDIAGREVKTLVNGALPEGDHSFEWRGQDNAGNGVGSGVYFYTLNTDGQKQTKKMVLIR